MPLIGALLAAALLGLLLGALADPAVAQDGGAPSAAEGGAESSEEGAKLETLLQETETAQQEIESGDISDERLTHWRTRLLEIRSRAATIETEAKRNLESARRLLNALGPPPEDGREPQQIAAQRQRLREQVAAREARVKQAELVSARVNELLSAVQDAARERFANRLLVKGPIALRPDTWIVGTEGFSDAWQVLVSRLAAVELPQRADWRRVLAIAGAIALCGLLSALAIRYALLRRFPHEEGLARSTTFQRVSGALLHTLFYLLVPAFVLGVLYAYLDAKGVLTGMLDDLARNVALAAVLGFLMDGMSRSVLAARAPSWRLAPVKDTVARRLQRLMAIIAVVFAGHVLIVRMSRVLEAGEAFFVVYQFLFSLLVLSLVLWLGLQRRAQRGAYAQPAAAERYRRPVAFALALAGAFAFAALLSATLGYYELSRYVLNRSFVMALLVGVLLLLRAAVHEGIAAAFEARRMRAGRASEEHGSGMLEFWLSAVADVVVLLAGILLALPLWGMEWTNIWTLVSTAMLGFSVGGISISLLDIAVAAALFAAILAATRAFQNALERRVFPQTRLDVGVRDSLRTVTGYAGLVLASLVALSTAGLNLSNLAIVAGALSVGIGFGLQAIVNNFVSGLILLFERPIKVGDWVVIGPHQGYVKRIRVRSTEIDTFDRSSVIVPNSDFISQSITNWTHGNRECRVIVPVPVAFGSDTQRVHDILLEAANAHPHVLRVPEAHVLLMGFGERGLDFELRVFSWDVNYFLTVASELRFAIDQRFRDAGIVVPVPQLDLRMRSASPGNRAPPPTDIPDPGTTPPSGGPGDD